MPYSPSSSYQQPRNPNSGTDLSRSTNTSTGSTSSSAGRAPQQRNARRPPTPQPIAYPTPVQTVKGTNALAPVGVYDDWPRDGQGYSNQLGDTRNGDYDDDEDEDDYVDIDSEETVGMDPYLGVRPRQVHRESQDVEFGHRTSLAARGVRRGWEVNVRMPRMRGMSKGLSRDKAKTLLHALKVPQNFSNLKSLRGLRRAHTVSHPTPPPFVFRDSQPVPQSIRQQYAELAPSDGTVHKSEDGFLAPPPPTAASTSAPVSLLDADMRSRRSQSQRISRSSQNSNSPPSLRRSHSTGSRRSAGTLEGTTVAHRSGSTQTHGETTVVHHNSGPISSYPSSYSQPSYSQPSRRTHTRTNVSSKPPTASYSTTLSSLGSIKTPTYATTAPPRSNHLAPVLRALHKLQRLPWVAQPADLPGALVPSGSPPRVAADFEPAVDSARSRFRVDGSNPTAVRDYDAAIQEESWYRSRMNQKQLQRALREQYEPSLAGGIGAVGSAYRNYFATARQHGRPLGYMYAPSPSRSTSTRVPASGSNTSHTRSASTDSGYAYSHGARPGYIRPSISGSSRAYSGSSGHHSQVPSQNSYSSAPPPPVPPKQTYTQPQHYAQKQMQQQPPVMYMPMAPGYIVPVQPSASTVSSPPLPPLPGYVSRNSSMTSSRSGSGSGYGVAVPPSVPLKYVQYSYSYI